MADTQKLEIKKITLPSGSEYYFKDEQARSDISNLQNAMTGKVIVLGTTTTSLTDGTTSAVVVINGEEKTAVAGNMVYHENKEFIYDGSKWIELGDLTSLGALAYKSSASTTYAPAGTISQPTFSGSSMTSTGTFTPTGSVELNLGNGDSNYTPAGTVSQPTFTGSEVTLQPTVTADGSVSMSIGNGNANYTPAGSVSKPDITVTPTTDNVYSITDVGTLPSLSATVADENLTLNFSQGTLPTKGSAQTVVTGASAALDNAPQFTGTGVDFEYSFTGTQVTGSVTYTPTGTVSQPTFTGTGVELVGAFTGTQGSVSVSGTPTGTVSQPTFVGTEATITVS